MEEINKFCQIYMSICGGPDPLDDSRANAVEAIMEYLENTSRRTFNPDKRKALANALIEIFFEFENHYV